MEAGNVNGALKSLIERIETAEEDKAETAAFIRDVYQEAKSKGFEVKVIRNVVKLRKMAKAEREELDALTESYMAAVGS